MTTLINEIDKNLEIIKDCNETIEKTINLRDNSIRSVCDKIRRLTYDECLMLIDKSNDMPEKIFDEILKRARYLWRIN